MQDVKSQQGAASGAVEWLVGHAQALLIATAIVPLAIFGVATHQRNKTNAVALQAAAANDVAPCTLIGLQEMAERPMKLKWVFKFQDIEYARRSGMAECVKTKLGAFAKTSTTICQFSSPGIVEVRMSTGIYRFRPTPGAPAKITFENGAPKCGSNGDFTVPNLLGYG